MKAPQADDDLSLADLERYFVQPYGLRFDQLPGFPAGSRTAKDGTPRWTCFDIVPWLTGFMRGLAPMTAAFHTMLASEAALRPEANAQDHRERALTRFADVAVARVLMRRLPEP